MPTLNVPLVRAAQASIRDTNNEFDMNLWRCCIAGHILRAAGVAADTTDRCEFKALELIGVASAPGLFYTVSVCDRHNRVEAVRRLNNLIAFYRAPIIDDCYEPQLAPTTTTYEVEPELVMC